MNILLASNTIIPVYAYGGTERVVWDLGRALSEMGHKVTFLAPAGSSCDFAEIIPIDLKKSWDSQIPSNTDIAHFHFHPGLDLETPHLFTEHGNARKQKPLPLNTIFISKNHAERYGSQHFIHNGLDWRNYPTVELDNTRKGFHFLGKASWPVKNIRGAINVAKLAGVDLEVLGGTRLNFKQGFRWTWDRNVHFHGMVGGEVKFGLLNKSEGLIFPVRWHEPFGLAVIESLYFGCPVFATPYGALPELIDESVGFLSSSAGELAHAIRHRKFSPQACHSLALTHFTAAHMASKHVEVYHRILSGETLHSRHPHIIQSARDLAWHD